MNEASLLVDSPWKTERILLDLIFGGELTADLWGRLTLRLEGHSNKKEWAKVQKYMIDLTNALLPSVSRSRCPFLRRKGRHSTESNLLDRRELDLVDRERCNAHACSSVLFWRSCNDRDRI